MVLLPLYAFAFAMWHWERKALIESRFTGQEGESVGGQSEQLAAGQDRLPLRTGEENL